MQRLVRARAGERRVRLGNGSHASYPSFAFDLGGALIDAVVFPEQAVREAPACPVSGGPMRRARPEEVERLLEEEA